MPTPKLARGATLIELVITIVLLGVVSVTIGAFLVPTFTANRAMERRAGLVDAAENSLRRMARDIRIALPNSVRISTTATTFAVEMIPTVDGGKYCTAGLANCNTVGANAILTIGAADTNFETLSCFRNTAFVTAAAPVGGSNAYRLVIGDLDGSAYAGAGVITTGNIRVTVQPAGTCGAATSRHRVTITGGHNFPNSSVQERFYVVQVAAAPVSYLCDSAAGTLRRFSGYALQAGQPTDPNAGPLNAATSIAQITGNVSRCGVLGDTNSVRTTGIVALQLGVAADNEAIELLHQVQLDNSL
jgi:MSHA biogenesis protein MshO